MKIHLPSALRRALLSCLACVSGVVSLSVSTGSLLGGAFVLSSGLAQATTFDKSDAQINSTTTDDLIFTYTEGVTTGEVSGTVTAKSITVNDKVDLALKGDNASLRVSTIHLAETARLTLNTAGLLSLSSPTFSGTGRLVLNYDTEATLSTALINASFGGTLELARGTYTLSGADATALKNLNKLVVTRSYNPNGAITSVGGALRLAADTTYNLNLELSGGGPRNPASAGLQIYGGTVLRGSLTMTQGLMVSAVGSADKAAIIESDIDARGYDFAMWYNEGDGTANMHIIWRKGKISNLGSINLSNGAHVEIQQNIDASNMAESMKSTFTVKKAGGANVAGKVTVSGTMSGFAALQADDSTLTIDGAFKGAGALAKRGGADVTLNGSVTDVTDLTLEGGNLIFNGDVRGLKSVTTNAGVGNVDFAGKLYAKDLAINVNGEKEFHVNFSGDLIGDGLVTKNNAGYLKLLGHLSHTGTLDIKEGNVELGDSDKAANSVSFSEIILRSGTTFYLNSAATICANSVITLDGGVLWQYDTDGAGDEKQHYFKGLNVAKASRIVSTWNGGVRFSQLTGEADLSIEKAVGGGEKALVGLGTISNYNGKITWVNGNNHDALTLRIDSAQQDEGYNAVVGSSGSTFKVSGGKFVMDGAGSLEVYGDMSLTSFNKLGSGTFTLHGNLSVVDELYMVYEGQLAVDNSCVVQLNNFTALHYDNGSANGETTVWDYLDTAGHLSVSSPSADIYVFAGDFDVAELLSEQGVNLHLNTQDIKAAHILALGYEDGEYEIHENSETGTWWLKGYVAPHTEAGGTDGIWDEAWGGELYNRPLSGSIHMYMGTDPDADGYLAGDPAYAARSIAGSVQWAEFRSGSLGAWHGAFGGAPSTAAEVVSGDAWLYVTSGYYGMVAGGNNGLGVNNVAAKTDYTGDTHIMLRGRNSRPGVVVYNVVGGNYSDAGGNQFTGNSWISVAENVNVYGFVVGGSMTQHNTTEGAFVGNTHVAVYSVLDWSGKMNPLDGNIAAADFARMPGMAPEAVIGGNLKHGGQNGPVFEGDGESTVTINLAGSSKSNGSVFGKMVVGADFATAKDDGATVDADAPAVTGMMHTGDTRVTITGASGVTFSGPVVGGSFIESQYDAAIVGNTTVNIGSGVYNDVVVAGSYTHGFVNAATSNVTAAQVSIEGDTKLDIRGGSFRGLSTDRVLEDGTVVRSAIGKVGLVGGSLLVNTYADGTVAGGLTIDGSTSLSLRNAQVSGHVVGGSVVVGESAAMGAVSVSGTSTLTVDGSTVGNNAERSKLVGGLLLGMPTEQMGADAGARSVGGGFSVGDVAVSVASSRVYDVVGGSWTSGLNVATSTVEQGSIQIDLRGGTTVLGDVYAGGIQGGSTAMTNGDVSVSIAAGVNFAKADGGDTILSGGYLSTRNGVESAYESLYSTASTCTGVRTLSLAESVNLAGVQVLNFDKIELSDNASVDVRALLLTDRGAQNEGITVNGAGSVKLDATLLSLSDAAGQTKRIRSNSAIMLQGGASLHVTNSHAADHLSFLEKVVAEDGSRVVLDLARDGGGNDTLHVLNGITMKGSSELTINFNGSASMQRYAIIREQSNEALPERGTSPALSLDHTKIDFNITFLESDLLTGRDVRLIIAESVEGDFVGGEMLSESLRKWFTNDARVLIEDYGKETVQRQLVMRGTTIDAATADYHSSRAVTVNGLVGAHMLDNLYTTVNPEATDPHGDRAALLNALEVAFAEHDYDAADRTMASAGGAALPAMVMALGDDVDRQLRAIRNRTTTTGLNSDYDYGELPQLNFWVNAEGDFRKVKGEGTNAGYKTSAWGGTLGMGAEVGEHTGVGLALTAMYSRLDVDACDKASGDMITTYISGYVRHNSGSWTHTLVGTVGMAKVDVSRTVDFKSGSYTAKADANGYAVGLMYEVGYSLMLNESGSACMQPVVNVAWRHAELGGFTEGGSDAGLKVDTMKHESVVVGAGVRFQALTGGELYNRTSILEGRLLLKGYAGDRDATSQAAFREAKYKGKMSTVEAGAFGVEIGAGLSVPIETENPSSIFVDVSAELRDAYTNFNASVGWKVTF